MYLKHYIQYIKFKLTKDRLNLNKQSITKKLKDAQQSVLTDDEFKQEINILISHELEERCSSEGNPSEENLLLNASKNQWSLCPLFYDMIHNGITNDEFDIALADWKVKGYYQEILFSSTCENFGKLND